jgi:hypothetical protein
VTPRAVMLMWCSRLLQGLVTDWRCLWRSGRVTSSLVGHRACRWDAPPAHHDQQTGVNAWLLMAEGCGCAVGMTWGSSTCGNAPMGGGKHEARRALPCADAAGTGCTKRAARLGSCAARTRTARQQRRRAPSTSHVSLSPCRLAVGEPATCTDGMRQHSWRALGPCLMPTHADGQGWRITTGKVISQCACSAAGMAGIGAPLSRNCSDHLSTLCHPAVIPV